MRIAEISNTITVPVSVIAGLLLPLIIFIITYFALPDVLM